MVANPICSGIEFERPAPLTPPRMKIWKSISVNPARKVAPIFSKMHFPDEWKRSFKLEIIDSRLGGMKEAPRTRPMASAQMNRQNMRLKWKMPGGERVQRTALLSVAQPRTATSVMDSPTTSFVASNIETTGWRFKLFGVSFNKQGRAVISNHRLECRTGRLVRVEKSHSSLLPRSFALAQTGLPSSCSAAVHCRECARSILGIGSVWRRWHRFRFAALQRLSWVEWEWEEAACLPDRVIGGGRRR